MGRQFREECTGTTDKNNLVCYYGPSHSAYTSWQTFSVIQAQSYKIISLDLWGYSYYLTTPLVYCSIWNGAKTTQLSTQISVTPPAYTGSLPAPGQLMTLTWPEGERLIFTQGTTYALKMTGHGVQPSDGQIGLRGFGSDIYSRGSASSDAPLNTLVDYYFSLLCEDTGGLLMFF